MLRPGQHTTEFLLTVALCVTVVASSIADVLTPRYAAIASAVAVAAYSIARGLAKIGRTKP